jgi:hypothetical protein
MAFPVARAQTGAMTGFTRGFTHSCGSVAAAAFLASGCAPAGPPDYPPTRRAETTDVLHGIEVADPYRWLEDLDDPEVVAWARAQDEVARAWASGPPRDALRDEIAAVAHVDRYGQPRLAFEPQHPRRAPATGVFQLTERLVVAAELRVGETEQERVVWRARGRGLEPASRPGPVRLERTAGGRGVECGEGVHASGKLQPIRPRHPPQ